MTWATTRLQHHYARTTVHRLCKAQASSPLVCGLGLTALGLAGLLLPILPGVPFLIMACSCYGRAARCRWPVRPPPPPASTILPHATAKNVSLQHRLLLLIALIL